MSALTLQTLPVVNAKSPRGVEVKCLDRERACANVVIREMAKCFAKHLLS